MLIIRPTIITLRVDYFRPDYAHILNEFVWQTPDEWPEIPRIHRFLNYWHKNIPATINKIYVQHSNRTDWRLLNYEFKCS